MSTQSSEYSDYDSSSPVDTDQDSVGRDETDESEEDKPQRNVQPATRQPLQYDPKSRLWSLAEFHLKAIDDAYKLDNWKLRTELDRTQQQLRLVREQRDQAVELVARRSAHLDSNIGYVHAIHDRMEADDETIRSLREKLKRAGIKEEDWKDIDALLVDLEESHAQSSEDIIDVAFEFQKDIDEGKRNVY